MHPGRSAEDNLFYLASASSTNAKTAPLSEILAATFEEKKSSKKDKKDKLKKDKRKKDDINMRDMLPAGERTDRG